MRRRDELRAVYARILAAANNRNNSGTAAALSDDIRLGNAYADPLHTCEADATRAGKVKPCVLDVKPSPQQSIPIERPYQDVPSEWAGRVN